MNEKQLRRIIEEEQEGSNSLVMTAMDIEAMYPNLNKQECFNVIIEETVLADVDCLEINYKELLRYLKLTLTNKEVNDYELNKYLPTRTSNKGRTPGLTNVKVLAAD